MSPSDVGAARRHQRPPSAARSARVVTFDVEIAVPPEEHLQGWEAARTGALGISAACAYDTSTRRYHLYDQHTLEALCDRIEAADLLVSFNGKHFDLPCLSGATSRYLHTAFHYDILEEVWIALGRRVEGYKLDDICKRTLGLHKNGAGAGAPHLARAGRWGELFDYNLNDVHLTRRLFNWIRRCGSIVDVEGHELVLDAPRAVA